MLLSPLLSLLADTYRSGSLSPKIKNKISILSIGLEKEALFKIIKGIIAKVFTAEGIITKGIPVI